MNVVGKTWSSYTFKHSGRSLYDKAIPGAQQLGYAQSSVTMQIQKLERSYGVQLFERYGRGLRLTSAGEELMKIAVQILDLYQQSKEKLTQQGGRNAIDWDDRFIGFLLSPATNPKNSA